MLAASLLVAISGGWATAFATNPNSQNFYFADCLFKAQAGFDTGYPVGDASTSNIYNGASCGATAMHATGDFFGSDNAYHTIYSGWVSTSTNASVTVFYWAYTTWVWDTSQVGSTPVSVLAS